MATHALFVSLMLRVCVCWCARLRLGLCACMYVCMYCCRAWIPVVRYGGLFVSLTNMGWVAYLRFINIMAFSYHLHMEAVYGTGVGTNYTCNPSGPSQFVQCQLWQNGTLEVDGFPNLDNNVSAVGPALITGQDVLTFFEIPSNALVVSLSVLVACVVFFRLVSFAVLHCKLVNDGTLDDSVPTASSSSSSSNDKGEGDDVNNDAAHRPLSLIHI